MKISNFITGLSLILIGSITSCAQKTETSQETMIQNNQNVKAFTQAFQNYGMDIQAAGIATIPAATFSEQGELYIEYAYNSEGENRKGKMTLTDKGNDRFEGNWKTVADNGNVYQGSLFFVFNTNGEAEGNYIYAGSYYKITIFTNKK